eukprot:TRINITY_DN5871_c0_g1_i1.p1 TRINITY_DN5871_c0_g1~~TRINITY_DN5871_c0_g1_i1.p1  ORF type:complete len:332 (-),score=43.30 TRINITY_DN5871_c0_g1_i1:102-950(-)
MVIMATAILPTTPASPRFWGRSPGGHGGAEVATHASLEPSHGGSHFGGAYCAAGGIDRRPHEIIRALLILALLSFAVSHLQRGQRYVAAAATAASSLPARSIYFHARFFIAVLGVTFIDTVALLSSPHEIYGHWQSVVRLVVITLIFTTLAILDGKSQVMVSIVSFISVLIGYEIWSSAAVHPSSWEHQMFHLLAASLGVGFLVHCVAWNNGNDFKPVGDFATCSIVLMMCLHWLQALYQAPNTIIFATTFLEASFVCGVVRLATNREKDLLDKAFATGQMS